MRSTRADSWRLGLLLWVLALVLGGGIGCATHYTKVGVPAVNKPTLVVTSHPAVLAFPGCVDIRGELKGPLGSEWLCASTTYYWNDGTAPSSHGESPCWDTRPGRFFNHNHCFLAPGVYKVALRLWDEYGAQLVESSTTIEVKGGE